MMIVVLAENEKGDENWQLLMTRETTSKGYFGSYSGAVAEVKIAQESLTR